LPFFEKISLPEIYLNPKKTPISLKCREDTGAFLPIAPSYFKVRLRHDRKNTRMKIILITIAAGNWGENGIRRGRLR
jgi:hypothetical protein